MNASPNWREVGNGLMSLLGHGDLAQLWPRILKYLSDELQLDFIFLASLPDPEPPTTEPAIALWGHHGSLGLSEEEILTMAQAIGAPPPSGVLSLNDPWPAHPSLESQGATPFIWPLPGEHHPYLCGAAPFPWSERILLAGRQTLETPLAIAWRLSTQHHQGQTQRDHYQILQTVSHCLSDEGNIYKLLPQILDCLMGPLDLAQAWFFHCHHHQHQEPRFQLAIAFPSLALDSPQTLEPDPILPILRNYSPQAVEVAAGELPALFPNPPERSPWLLFVPLCGKRSPQSFLGTLVFQKTARGPGDRRWPLAEKNLLTLIGRQLSDFLITQHTLEKVQKMVSDRTSKLKWSLNLQGKLSEKMRQQITELKHLNQLKDDFLSSMSHELNTPLTTMKVALKMLQRPDLCPDRQTTYLQILEQELIREQNLIHNLLKLQRLESQALSRPKYQPLQLDELLQPLIQDFQEKWSSTKGLTLTVAYHNFPENYRSISSDAQSLTAIFEELLLNGGKYAEPHTPIHVQVTRRLQALHIDISNYGTEIPKDAQAYIFDKFRRGQGMTDLAIAGTGLGLALVKSQLEQLNGEITVSSIPSGDRHLFLNTFTITLPSAQSLIME